MFSSFLSGEGCHQAGADPYRFPPFSGKRSEISEYKTNKSINLHCIYILINVNCKLNRENSFALFLLILLCLIPEIEKGHRHVLSRRQNSTARKLLVLVSRRRSRHHMIAEVTPSHDRRERLDQNKISRAISAILLFELASSDHSTSSDYDFSEVWNKNVKMSQITDYFSKKGKFGSLLITKSLSGTTQPCKQPCWNGRRPLKEKYYDSLGWPSDQRVGNSIWQWWPRNSSTVPICCSLNAAGIERNAEDVLWPVFYVSWRFVAVPFKPRWRDDFMAKKVGTKRSKYRPSNCGRNFKGDRFRNVS